MDAISITGLDRDDWRVRALKAEKRLQEISRFVLEDVTELCDVNSYENILKMAKNSARYLDKIKCI